MTTGLRKAVLIALLMIIAAAFAYDQLVVKRRTVRIQAELMDLVNDTSHTYSEDEILRLVGEPYQTVYESRQKKIVKFSWRGVGWRTHDLFVVFRRLRGDMLISDVSLIQPEVSKPFIDPRGNASSNDSVTQIVELPSSARTRPSRPPD